MTSDSAGIAAQTPDTVTEWRRLHPWSIVTTGMRNLRGLIVPIVLVIVTRGFSGGRSDLFFTFGLPIVAAMVAIFFGFLHWWRFRYAVTPRDLVIRSGLISREERIVPLERIQVVDFEEPPLERVLQITRVRVESAATGSDDARIVLHSLGRDDALHFRHDLLLARQHAIAIETPVIGATPSIPPEPATRALDFAGDSELIRRLSTRELLLAGATSGRIGPAAAVLGIAVQFSTDAMPGSWWNHIPWRGATSGNVDVIAGLVILLGLLAWFLAIGSTVLTHAGFELRRAGNQLTIQHGLLERRRSTVPLRRIQAIALVEGLIRQPFGYGELRFESAGQAGDDDGRSGVLFPFLKMREMTALIARVTPDFALAPDPGAIHGLPRRALRRYLMPGIIWTVLVASILNLVFWRWFGGVRWWTLAVFVLVPIVILIRWSRYRFAGWYVSPVHFMMRWRTIGGRTTLITCIPRLQHRSLTANPFQRRARLVTVHASIASGGSGGHFALPQVDRGEAEHLLWQLSPTVARRFRAPDSPSPTPDDVPVAPASHP